MGETFGQKAKNASYQNSLHFPLADTLSATLSDPNVSYLQQAAEKCRHSRLERSLTHARAMLMDLAGWLAVYDAMHRRLGDRQT